MSHRHGSSRPEPMTAKVSVESARCQLAGATGSSPDTPQSGRVFADRGGRSRPSGQVPPRRRILGGAKRPSVRACLAFLRRNRGDRSTELPPAHDGQGAGGRRGSRWRAERQTSRRLDHRRRFPPDDPGAAGAVGGAGRGRRLFRGQHSPTWWRCTPAPRGSAPSDRSVVPVLRAAVRLERADRGPGAGGAGGAAERDPPGEARFVRCGAGEAGVRREGRSGVTSQGGPGCLPCRRFDGRDAVRTAQPCCGGYGSDGPAVAVGCSVTSPYAVPWKAEP
jgi:hypothetical protein